MPAGLIAVPDEMCMRNDDIASIKERTVKLSFTYNKDTFVIDDQVLVNALEYYIDPSTPKRLPDPSCLWTPSR
jgi:hypothetical protein